MTPLEIIYLILVFIFGWLMVNLIIGEITREEHVGLALLFGFGTHSVLYFIIVLCWEKFVINNLLFLVGETVIAVIFSFIFKKFPLSKHVFIDNHKRNYLGKILKAISLIVLLYTFLQCIYWPVYEPDALSLYDFRAQRLLSGDLNTFFGGTTFYHNGAYPPFTSLMHFFLYQVGAVNPKIIYAIIFIALYLVIVGYVKRATGSNNLGLLAGTLVILTPSVWWNSFGELTNVIYMTYISLAVLYLFDYVDNKKTDLGRTLLGAALLGFAVWVRSEPFWVVPAIMVFLKGLVKRQVTVLVVFFIIFFPMSFLWKTSLYISPNTTTTAGSISNNAQNIAYSINVGIYNVKNITTAKALEIFTFFFPSFYQSWGYILPLFLLIFLLEITLLRKSFPWIQITTILLSVAIIFGIIYFSVEYKQWMELSSSVYRMATITIPLYWVSIITSKIWLAMFMVK